MILRWIYAAPNFTLYMCSINWWTLTFGLENKNAIFSGSSQFATKPPNRMNQPPFHTWLHNSARMHKTKSIVRKVPPKSKLLHQKLIRCALNSNRLSKHCTKWSATAPPPNRRLLQIGHKLFPARLHRTAPKWGYTLKLLLLLLLLSPFKHTLYHIQTNRIGAGCSG